MLNGIYSLIINLPTFQRQIILPTRIKGKSPFLQRRLRLSFRRKFKSVAHIRRSELRFAPHFCTMWTFYLVLFPDSRPFVAAPSFTSLFMDLTTTKLQYWQSNCSLLLQQTSVAVRLYIVLFLDEDVFHFLTFLFISVVFLKQGDGGWCESQVFSVKYAPRRWTPSFHPRQSGDCVNTVCACVLLKHMDEFMWTNQWVVICGLD